MENIKYLGDTIKYQTKLQYLSLNLQINNLGGNLK